MPYIRLAQLKKGRIMINPRVPRKYHVRLKRHMRVFREARKQGVSRTKAIRMARNSEHKGMTPKEVRSYEGRLGALARYGK